MALSKTKLPRVPSVIIHKSPSPVTYHFTQPHSTHREFSAIGLPTSRNVGRIGATLPLPFSNQYKIPIGHAFLVFVVLDIAGTTDQFSGMHASAVWSHAYMIHLRTNKALHRDII